MLGARKTPPAVAEAFKLIEMLIAVALCPLFLDVQRRR